MPHDSAQAAIVVLGGMEFAAHCELRRFLAERLAAAAKGARVAEGLAHAGALRATPLIPCRLLVPLASARAREMHYVKGVRGPDYLLKTGDGKPLTIADAMVRELAEARARRRFRRSLSAAMRSGSRKRRAPGRDQLASAGASVRGAVSRGRLIYLPTVQFQPRPRLLEAGQPEPGHALSPWIKPVSAAALAGRARARRARLKTAGRRGSGAPTRHKLAPLSWPPSGSRGGRGFGSFARLQSTS